MQKIRSFLMAEIEIYSAALCPFAQSYAFIKEDELVLT
jgi:hypothetical protein